MAEYPFAVFSVLESVQNMPVPKSIHVLAWRKGFLGMSYRQGEEALVPHLHAVGVFARPTMTLCGIHQLELDRIEVKGLYCCDHLFDGSVGQFRLHCFLLVRVVKHVGRSERSASIRYRSLQWS